MLGAPAPEFGDTCAGSSGISYVAAPAVIAAAQRVATGPLRFWQAFAVDWVWSHVASESYAWVSALRTSHFRTIERSERAPPEGRLRMSRCAVTWSSLYCELFAFRMPLIHPSQSVLGAEVPGFPFAHCE